MNIINANEQNLKEIVYDSLRMESSSAIVNAVYQGKSPLYFLLAVTLQNENIHILTSKSYLDIYVNDEHLIEQFMAFDEYNIQTVLQNSEKWFSKEIPIDVIREFYQPILNKKKNDNRYFIRAKINVMNNSPVFHKVTKLFSSTNGEFLEEKIDTIDSFEDRDTLYNALVEFKGMRFGKQTFWCDICFDGIEQVELVTKIESPLIEKIEQEIPIVIEENTQVQSVIDISNIPAVETVTDKTLSYSIDESVQREIQNDVQTELTELLPEDIEKIAVFENISLRKVVEPAELIEMDLQLEEENNPIRMQRIFERKKMAIDRQSKYLSSLEELKTNVEEEVRKALQKRDKINEKYSMALEELHQIENTYDYSSDDDIIDDYIIEQLGTISRKNSEDLSTF